ncbi:MAG: GNAT family N-acetyltransferase [Proteobacteria bacterium]|nr:MAG: GNAT family N-acetyltransferase [Pseudomonadota bacterium]
MRVRTRVFFVEQGVPESLEVDGRDPQCIHVAAFCADRILGTGRLLPDGRIGRMAVLAESRSRGIGGRMLETLVDAARARGDAQVRLAAQVGAIPFYSRHGFVARGDKFIEAGILHQEMVRGLGD